MSYSSKSMNGKSRTLPSAVAGPVYCDPVIEAYKKDVDRTLLLENLKLTVQERFLKFERFMQYVQELQQAGQTLRSKGSTDGIQLS